MRFSPRYIRFCVQTRLERPAFQAGDWYVHMDFLGDGPRVVTELAETVSRFGSSEYRVWLPLEGDWIELLLRIPPFQDADERAGYIYGNVLERIARHIQDPGEAATLRDEPNLLLSLARAWTRFQPVKEA